MTARYESAFQTIKGPGDGRPTANQIIEDEQLRGKWSDKTILITSCSSGIGIETAKSLFETGATLYLTARDLNKADEALGAILDSNRVHLLELDLNSLASGQKCAKSFLSKLDRLNVLIANAGVMATPEGRTLDGFETQFGTNHLAHFLLIQLLIPKLLKSSTGGFKSRVVCLSSSAHRLAQVNFSKLNFEGEYETWTAYGQSRTANVYTANELNRRYKSKDLHTWAAYPGVIHTGLTRHMTEDQLKEADTDPSLGKMMKSPQQGAATSVWAAVAKSLEGEVGTFLKTAKYPNQLALRQRCIILAMHRMHMIKKRKNNYGKGL